MRLIAAISARREGLRSQGRCADTTLSFRASDVRAGRQVICARGGTRTRMGFPPQDFKSRASTDFATPACSAIRFSAIPKDSVDLWLHRLNVSRKRETGLEPATPTLARLCSTN